MLVWWSGTIGRVRDVETDACPFWGIGEFVLVADAAFDFWSAGDALAVELARLRYLVDWFEVLLGPRTLFSML